MIPIVHAAFLRCLEHLYPDGITNKHQHRDLLKVFLMGWIEAAHQNGFEARDALAIAKQATDYNWWPDPSWFNK